MALQQESVVLQVTVLVCRDTEDEDDLGFVRTVAADVSSALDEVFSERDWTRAGYEAVEVTPVGWAS